MRKPSTVQTSRTVTSVVQVVERPASLVAVKVTVVVPRGTSVGEWLTTGSASQSSVAGGGSMATTVDGDVRATVSAAGQVMSGGVGSVTETVVAQLSLPPVPVEVKVTVVSPTGKTGGASWTTEVAGPQDSSIEGSGTVTAVPPGPVQVAVTTGVQVTAGTPSGTA